MTRENISLFSVLHVAVELGHEQVVYNVIQLLQQLPPTEQRLLDSRNNLNKV